MELEESLLQGMKPLPTYLTCYLVRLAACQGLRSGMLQRLLKLVQPWAITSAALLHGHQWYSGMTLSISSVSIWHCEHVSKPLAPRWFVLNPAGRGEELQEK